MFEMYELGITF